MPIHQSKHQSDLEKRLKILRQQFYGKEEETKLEVSSGKSNLTLQYPTSSLREASHLPHPTSNSESFRTDATYLRADLMKISTLAGTALGIQIILYFLLKNNVLNINLF